MKKTLMSTSLIAALAISAFSVNAASTGTITFNGELTDSTCNVDVNGQGADATVVLPTVSVNQLTASGETTGRTSFNMNLANCVVGTQGDTPKWLRSSSLAPPLI
ncbi:major fimbrial protein StkA [Raoultella planticola]|nr:major fimbrial protein StkA [Raoultella planticola]